MRNPFKHAEKPVKPPVQPPLPPPVQLHSLRQEDGKFVKAPDIAKQVNVETSAISGTLGVLTEINKLIASQNELINSRVASILEGYAEPPEPDGMGWAEILKQIAPYVAPYLPKLLEKYAGVTPSAPVEPNSPPPAESPTPPPQEDIITYIRLASKASPIVIKPFIPKLLEEVEKKGINPKEFIQAIHNIDKAI